MALPVEILIARRYLVSRRQVRFINVIGLISIVGITAGVAALVVALSVFNGFNGVVTSVLVGFDPHLRIEVKGGADSSRLAEIEKAVRGSGSIAGESPFVSGKAMLVAQSFNRVVYIRGVDGNRIAGASGLADKMLEGSISLGDSAGLPGMVIGLTLADRLGSVVGQRISIVSPYGLQSAFSSLGEPRSVDFRVAGIYSSNNREYDANYAYISLPAAQELFNMRGAVHGVEVRLADIARAEEVKTRLAGALPPGCSVSTWYDLHQSLYSVMAIERWSAYVLLSLIILVATFNMLGSLSMGVVEKKRDIGVLQSLGMTRGGIVRIFMAEGILIGVAGTCAGMLLGLFVLVLQIEYSIFPLDTTIYIIPAIPVEIRWTDFLSVACASLGLSLAAAFYPARKAAALMPADVVRWE